MNNVSNEPNIVILSARITLRAKTIQCNASQVNKLCWVQMGPKLRIHYNQIKLIKMKYF